MTLDEQLDHAAAAVRDVPVDIPPFAPRGHRRRPSRGVLVSTGVAAALVVVAALVVSGQSTQPVRTRDENGSTSTIPVVPDAAGLDLPSTIPPDPTTVPAPASAPTCTNDDLDITVGNPSDGSPDHLGTRLLAFSNTSPTACSLSGHPTVTGVLADGTRVAATPGEPEAEIHGPEVTTSVIPPGEAAIAVMAYPQDCADRPAATTALVSIGTDPIELSLPLAPPDDGRVDPGPGGLGEAVPTSCGLQIGSYTTAVGLGSNMRSVAQLQYSIDLPHQVRAGTAVTVRLIAHNPTNRTITFDPCPGYQLLFFASAARFSYGGNDAKLLNCAAAPPVPPGGSVAFELSIDIPVDSPAGTGAVVWTTSSESMGNVMRDTLVHVVR